MTKHFEDVWLEAEEITSEAYEMEKALFNFEKLVIVTDELIIDDKFLKDKELFHLKDVIGKSLLSLAFICKQYNINSWQELEKAINNLKIDSY